MVAPTLDQTPQYQRWFYPRFYLPLLGIYPHLLYYIKDPLCVKSSMLLFFFL